MGTKISKAEFDALPDVLKAKFQASGDDYELHEEDVTGLKKNKQELLDELKSLKSKYGDIDPDAARKAIEAAQLAEDEKLKAEGDFEKLKEQLIERHNQELTKARGDYDSLLTNLKKESLKNFITERYKVRPEAVKSAIAEGDLDNVLEFEFGETGPKFKKKGGIGDEPELDALFKGLSEKAPWCFNSQVASGSGASGSQGNGGSGTPKTATKAEVAAMDPATKREFYIGGGEVTG